MPSIKKQRKVVVLAVSAGICNSAFSLFMPGGWSIIIATLVASLGVELFNHERGRLT
jgi:predicted branched-subunit amino acid permease